jgi:hypothetical protein
MRMQLTTLQRIHTSMAILAELRMQIVLVARKSPTLNSQTQLTMCLNKRAMGLTAALKQMQQVVWVSVSHSGTADLCRHNSLCPLGISTWYCSVTAGTVPTRRVFLQNCASSRS